MMDRKTFLRTSFGGMLGLAAVLGGCSVNPDAGKPATITNEEPETDVGADEEVETTLRRLDSTNDDMMGGTDAGLEAETVSTDNRFELTDADRDDIYQPNSDGVEAAEVAELRATQVVALIKRLYNSCPYTISVRDDFVQAMSGYGITCDESLFHAFTEDGTLAEYDPRNPQIKMAVAGYVIDAAYSVYDPTDESYEPQGARQLDVLDGDRVLRVEIDMCSGLVNVTNSNNYRNEVSKGISAMKNDENRAQYYRAIEITLTMDGEGQPTGNLVCSNPDWWW